MLDISLPGTGGTVPLKNRWLACAIFRMGKSCVLIDCGEGTQIAVKEAGFTFKPIDVICITHFHADHISGLPGLLLTMGNEGRREPVVITGPEGVGRVVSALRIIAPELPFEVKCVEMKNGGFFKIGEFEITSVPVCHTVPCLCYSFRTRRAGLFDPEKAAANNVPMKVWTALQKNGEAELDGIRYTKDMILGKERKGFHIVYCTDTRPVKAIAEIAAGADLFICEGMYGCSGKESNALKNRHMTMQEAAILAAEAKPALTWLTHFSPSLQEPEKDITEAQSVCPSVYPGYDGINLTLCYK